MILVKTMKVFNCVLVTCISDSSVGILQISNSENALVVIIYIRFLIIFSLKTSLEYMPPPP